MSGVSPWARTPRAPPIGLAVLEFTNPAPAQHRWYDLPQVARRAMVARSPPLCRRSQHSVPPCAGSARSVCRRSRIKLVAGGQTSPQRAALRLPALQAGSRCEDGGEAQTQSQACCRCRFDSYPAATRHPRRLGRSSSCWGSRILAKGSHASSVGERGNRSFITGCQRHQASSAVICAARRRTVSIETLKIDSNSLLSIPGTPHGCRSRLATA